MPFFPLWLSHLLFLCVLRFIFKCSGVKFKSPDSTAYVLTPIPCGAKSAPKHRSSALQLFSDGPESCFDCSYEDSTEPGDPPSDIVEKADDSEEPQPQRHAAFSDEAREIAAMCSYADNPHLRAQIQTRFKNYNTLRYKYNVNPYPEVNSDDYDELSAVISSNQRLQNGEEADDVYRVFGRIDRIRNGGQFVDITNITRKFSCFDSADLSHKALETDTKVQLMFRLQEPLTLVGGQAEPAGAQAPAGSHMASELVELLDIGDVVEVSGNVKKTNVGEISVIPRTLRFLAKCMVPLPNRTYGLKDVETRFRLRHVDLLTNDESRIALLKRFQVVSKIRSFLAAEGYVEIDTPTLQSHAGGDLAKPFETFYNKLGERVKLRVAPEISIKKVLMGLPLTKVGRGTPQAFEVAKCFRNEGTSLTHSPEFTMVEIYRKMADFNAMVALLERLVDYVLSYSTGDGPGCTPSGLRRVVNPESGAAAWEKAENFNAYEVRWLRRTFAELVREHAGIDLAASSKIELEGRLREAADAAGGAPDAGIGPFATWGEAANALFEKLVVPNLKSPTHVTHLPASISPLCYNGGPDAPADDRGLFSNRFESYLGGVEVANGCTEQCNPFALSKSLVSAAGASNVDPTFLHAAFCGMEPMAGLGVGVDRLVMYVTGAKNIKEVQPLPSLRRV